MSSWEPAGSQELIGIIRVLKVHSYFVLILGILNLALGLAFLPKVMPFQREGEYICLVTYSENNGLHHSSASKLLNQNKKTAFEYITVSSAFIHTSFCIN
jgi:uncharacterized protein YkuJ